MCVEKYVTKEKMKMSTSEKKIPRASSEFSFFAVKSPRAQSQPLLSFRSKDDQVWLDDIWYNMTQAQRIDAVLPYTDDKGRGVMINAVRNHDRSLIYTLLNNSKMNVNQSDVYGNTALHHAALHKDTEILSILLNSPLIISCSTNRDDRTPWDILSENYLSFENDVREHCFARLLIDKAIKEYAHKHTKKVSLANYDPALLKTLQDAVRQQYLNAWFLSSEYKHRQFPDYTFPTKLQYKIIEHHFALYTRL
jgi:hypothetical protein